jgi:putative GTP pyrophosphokinase
MPIPSSESDELAKTWGERPDVIRQFLEIRPQNEQLCSEVAYILTKRIGDQGIEYSAITSRAKTLKSFAEKLSRKHYTDPLNDVTDLAGVRIVYLYKSDLAQIEKIVERELQIIEKVDKAEEHDADRFGYSALHYLVKLGRKSSGARYDDLKGLVCEVQVRTVLQDSWAIIDHHLSYKQESDVPKILKRKLNSLSGLFETADDQFDRVRAEREEYRQLVKSKLSSRENFLSQDTNLDTFTEFLKWKFPKKPIARDDSHLSRILTMALRYGYTKLGNLDELVRRTDKAREAVTAERGVTFAVGEMARAIALVHPKYLAGKGWAEDSRALLRKHRALVAN